MDIPVSFFEWLIPVFFGDFTIPEPDEGNICMTPPYLVQIIVSVFPIFHWKTQGFLSFMIILIVWMVIPQDVSFFTTGLSAKK